MRSQRMMGACAAVVALTAAACGSSVESGTGGGGTGGGATGSGGAGGAGGQLPAECVVETAEPAPHAVTFHFINPGPDPLYLWQDCTLGYEILSCADGYTDPLARIGACTNDCNAAPGGGCIVCGPCPSSALEVPAGGQQTDDWSGHHYTFGTDAEGCSCHVQHDARSGRYRVKVRVFTSTDEDAPPPYEVTVDFELPAPGGVVDVPLAPPL